MQNGKKMLLFVFGLGILGGLRIGEATASSIEAIETKDVIQVETYEATQQIDFKTGKTVTIEPYVQITYISDKNAENQSNIISDNTIQINPNTQRIYSSDVFKKVDNQWKLIEYATSTIEEYNLKFNKVSFFPVVHAQEYPSSGGTGHIQGINANWNTLREVTTGDNNYTPDNSGAQYIQTNLIPGYSITNAFFNFDTSNIPDVATIDSVKIYLNTNNVYTTTKEENNAGSSDLYFYAGTQGDTLTTADFRTYGTTKLGTITYENWDANDNVYESVLLASTTPIDKTGSSYFSIRPSGDVDNITPTTNNYIVWHGVSTSGTAQDPYLEVEYTVTDTETTSGGLVHDGITAINDLTVIETYHETWSGTNSSSTLQSVEWGYYHLPILAWLVLASLYLWVMSRFVLELIIRLRQ